MTFGAAAPALITSFTLQTHRRVESQSQLTHPRFSPAPWQSDIIRLEITESYRELNPSGSRG